MWTRGRLRVLPRHAGDSSRIREDEEWGIMNRIAPIVLLIALISWVPVARGVAPGDDDLVLIEGGLGKASEDGRNSAGASAPSTVPVRRVAPWRPSVMQISTSMAIIGGMVLTHRLAPGLRWPWGMVALLAGGFTAGTLAQASLSRALDVPIQWGRIVVTTALTIPVAHLAWRYFPSGLGIPIAGFPGAERIVSVKGAALDRFLMTTVATSLASSFVPQRQGCSPDREGSWQRGGRPGRGEPAPWGERPEAPLREPVGFARAGGPGGA